MFVVLVLHGRNQLRGFNIVSVGTLTASLVHPREVFKPAILANAAALGLRYSIPPYPTIDPRGSAKKPDALAQHAPDDLRAAAERGSDHTAEPARVVPIRPAKGENA